mgnify:FL=1
MAITFPSNPSPGATHTAAGITWEWDGTSWVSLAPSGGGGGGASALGDLTDVTLTSLTTDQVIRYDGTSEWLNELNNVINVTTKATDNLQLPLILGSAATGNVETFADNTLTYNPSTSTIAGADISGSATGLSGNPSISITNLTVGGIANFTNPTDATFTGGITTGNGSSGSTQWNAAYNWGDHSTQGYLVVGDLANISINTFNDVDTATAAPTNGQALIWDSTAGKWEPGNAATAAETDPVFTASPAGSITLAKLSEWNAAYGWGDHSTAGYLTQVALPDLTDVTISSLVNGDLIKYNSSTSQWENFTPTYLTAESDTLDTVTNRGNTTSNNLTIGDLTITGNLLVQGTTTNTNVNTLSVTNNEIIINDGTTGSPSQNGSIRIDRGTDTDTVLRWNESTDKWEWTNDGTNYYNLNNYTLSVGTTLSSNEATVTLTATDGTTSSYQILALGGTTLTHEPANNRITFNSVQPVNADWNSSSGLTQILNKPTSFYTLPQATTTVLGGVRVDGTSITIDPSNGQISAAPSGYTLPAATGATLGGVIVGAGLSVSSTGVLSSNVQSLPVASATVLGGIKIGSGLAIDSSTGIATVTLPTASSTVLGGVKVGNGLAIDSSGVLSTNSSAISIASPTTLGGIKNGPSINVDQTSGVTNIVPATSSQLGGVIVGSGLSITAAGILSATGGGGGGGGGTLSSRTTVSGTTILLAPGTFDTLDITGFKSYALIQINLSDAAWCRIYSSSQARTNDLNRNVGEDPAPGSGVIAEVITTGQNQEQIITPFTLGGNTESPVSTNIYVAVTNLSGQNTTITATLTILQLEN